MGNVKSSLQSAAEDRAQQEAKNYAGQQMSLRWEQCKYMTSLRLVFAMILVFGLWSAAISGLTSLFSIPCGFYCLFLAIFVTLLEFSWIINKCACCNEEQITGKIWKIVMRLDDYKRGIVYVLLAIPLFIPGFTTIWSAIVGICQIGTGVLYVSKKWQYTDSQPLVGQDPGAQDDARVTGGPPPQGGTMQDPGQYYGP